MTKINLEQLKSECQIGFARSGGKGGQNVNKVETKVQLSWSPLSTRLLSEQQRSLLLRNPNYGVYANQRGVIQVSSERQRTQLGNLEDGLKKLAAIIIELITPPKKRKRSRPSFASKERRIAGKKARKVIKQSRGRVRG